MVLRQAPEAEKFRVDAVGHHFNEVVFSVLNEFSIGSADDSLSVKIVENGGFEASESAVFDAVQPAYEPRSQAGLASDAGAQRIHVIDDLGYVMHVLHIGCHTHQLAVDEVWLNFVDPRIEAALGCALVEPVHLEWPRTQRRQCKPAETLNSAHSVNFEATDDAGQRSGFGLHVCCVSGSQAEQIDVMGFGQFPHLVVSTQLIPLIKWPRKPRREYENFHRSKMRWMERMSDCVRA